MGMHQFDLPTPVCNSFQDDDIWDHQKPHFRSGFHCISRIYELRLSSSLFVLKILPDFFYTSSISSALSYISHRNMLDFATTLAPAPDHRYCGSQTIPKFVRLKIQNHQMFRMFFFKTKMNYISDFEVIAHHFLCVVSCVHLIWSIWKPDLNVSDSKENYWIMYT